MPSDLVHKGDLKQSEHTIYISMVDFHHGSVVQYRALLEVKCTCGFEVVKRGKRGDASEVILFHRLAVIEERLGIKTTIQHVL